MYTQPTQAILEYQVHTPSEAGMSTGAETQATYDYVVTAWPFRGRDCLQEEHH